MGDMTHEPATDTELSQQEQGEQQDTPPNTFLYSVTGQTPWWIVSILLHGLVIVLAGLVTMQIDLGREEALVITQTEIPPPKEIAIVEPKSDPSKVLSTEENKVVTTNEPVDAQMIVSEAFKQLVELSNEMETNNPESPDEDGAWGRPDSFVRLTAAGSVDEPGGGGTDGVALMDETIGVNAGSIGTNGGWGGGRDGGQGTGIGKGLGERGNWRKGNKVRNYTKVGLTTQSQSSLDAALKWLAYHQEADGSWNAKKYGASAKTDTAVTGFALLAFLGAGHTEKHGEYKTHVANAVQWLKSKQDADGMIWDTTDDNAHHRAKGYPCAIATLALVEAGGMSNVKDTRVAAQKAVDYVCNIHQFGDGYDKRGWRYAPKSEGDLSVTGWFVMALKSAKVCGFHVPEESMQGAIKFLDSVEVKEQGAGNDAYGQPSRYKYMVNNDHIHTAHRLTAIGTLARQFLGWKADELRPTVEWFVNKGGVPSYGANGESVDLYYWYYASLACYQQHKVQPELWNRWCEAMKTAIVTYQCKDGDDRGSWNPVGDYSSEWGRVGQTALNALCLEVWYRYKVMDAGAAN